MRCIFPHDAGPASLLLFGILYSLFIEGQGGLLYFTTLELQLRCNSSAFRVPLLSALRLFGAEPATSTMPTGLRSLVASAALAAGRRRAVFRKVPLQATPAGPKAVEPATWEAARARTSSQWLGAQWLGLTLGVSGCREPPGAP